MASKFFFVQLLFRVAAMLMNCFAIAFIVLSTDFYMVWINLILILLYQVWELIRFINTTNRRIAAVIDNLKNNDTSISIPPAYANKDLKDLYASLSALVSSMANTKNNLVANNLFHKHLIEHAASGLLALKTDGRIETANKAIRQLLGIGYLHNIKQITHKDSELAQKIMHPNYHQTVTHQFWNGSEYRTLDLIAGQVVVQNETLVLVSVQDITEPLEQKEVQSWQKLIRVLSHEIMNTIAPITSLTAAIRKRLDAQTTSTVTEQDLKKATEGLLMIEERNEALTDFVHSYRKLSQLPVPQFKTIKLSEFLHSICSLMKAELSGEGVVLSTKFEAIEIRTDPALLGQVIINLLQNAREAMIGQPEKRITMSAFAKPDRGYVISVTDSGPGIDPAIIDKIFVPFYTTKANGSGIGLSLSKQIVISLGGTLRVQSMQPEFSAFSLDF